MIRLTLRQFRTQAWVALGLLLLTAVVLGATGPHMAKLYDDFAKAHAGCRNIRCLQGTIKISEFDKLLELIGTALVALPGLIGAFWGAPLVTRELEQGTFRLAWTQSVSRTRWLAVKLAVIGAASVVTTGLLSLMVTWWSSPLDTFDQNRFDSGLFGERNITPLGYAAFAFALGVIVGILIRRTLPAMATTLGAFLAFRLAFTYLIRKHLLAPVHTNQPLAAAAQGFGQSNGGPPTLFAGANLPGSWVYSTDLVDNAGHALTSHATIAACPSLLSTFTDPGPISTTPVHAPAGVEDAFNACVSKLSASYHGIVTYQPADRYWTMQWIETGIFLTAAAVLITVCFRLLRRRAF